MDVYTIIQIILILLVLYIVNCLYKPKVTNTKTRHEKRLQGHNYYYTNLYLESQVHPSIVSSRRWLSETSSSPTVTEMMELKNCNDKQEEKRYHLDVLGFDQIEEKKSTYEVNSQSSSNRKEINLLRNPNVKEKGFEKSSAVDPKKDSFKSEQPTIEEITKPDYSVKKESFAYCSPTLRESVAQSAMKNKEDVLSLTCINKLSQLHHTNELTCLHKKEKTIQTNVFTPKKFDSKNHKSSNEGAVNLKPTSTLVTRSAIKKTCQTKPQRCSKQTIFNKSDFKRNKGRHLVEDCMETEDDKENLLKTRCDESQMDSDIDDLNLNNEADEMDSKNITNYVKLSEENMNFETEDFNETVDMLVDVTKSQPNNLPEKTQAQKKLPGNDSCQNYHKTLQKATVKDGQKIYGQLLDNSVVGTKISINSQGSKKSADSSIRKEDLQHIESKKPIMDPISNMSPTQTQTKNKPSGNDNFINRRKTLNRIIMNTNQKKFVLGYTELPSNLQNDKIVNSQESKELLTVTPVKEKKRIMTASEKVLPETKLDSLMIKKKSGPPTYLIKFREKWILSKAQMKQRNAALQCQKTMNFDFISDKDLNSIEVSGIDCNICYSRCPNLECTWCPNGHRICLNCIRKAIKDTLYNKKLHLSCPKMFCNATIHFEQLSQKVDPIAVDILNKKLQKWLQKAREELVRHHKEALEHIFENFICPNCHIQLTVKNEKVNFNCHICKNEFCKYCQCIWSSSFNHNECQSLKYFGPICFLGPDHIPANWEVIETSEANNIVKNVPILKDVDLQSGEGQAVIKLFGDTSQGIMVTAIRRIQNIKLWEKYDLKRKHMIDEIGLSEIKERALFHGTAASNILLICDEGFDMRVETAHGAMYGKGIYFSTKSHYSKRYSGNSEQMFLTRVLCGKSTPGSLNITRPPKHPISNRMYDSCVDYITPPTIFVLFDNAQCYPAYIISYK